MHVGQHSESLPHPELLTVPSGMIVRQNVALARFVVLANVAPVKSALTRHDPLRFATDKVAPRALTPRRLARLMLHPVQLRFSNAVEPSRSHRLTFAPMRGMQAPGRQQEFPGAPPRRLPLPRFLLSRRRL